MIFLTGAFGFVGTQLIAFLSKVKGDSVVALSRSAQADDKIKTAAEALPTLGWPPQGPRPAPGKVGIVCGDLSAKEVLINGWWAGSLLGPIDCGRALMVAVWRLQKRDPAATKATGCREFTRAGLSYVHVPRRQRLPRAAPGCRGQRQR